MEAHILKQLSQNDSATQKAVYYQHADRLMAIVLRYVPSTIEAEDVLQECFVQIFDKVKMYKKDKGSFEAWSAKIAINFALMFLRKKRNLVFYEEDLHAQELKTTNEAMQKLENEDIEKLISILDEKYAVIFKLKAIDGYKHQEIAEMLGIQKDASKTIYSRARKQLKQFFNSDEPELFSSNKVSL